MALAPSPNRTAGIASMTIDGVTYAIASGLEWQIADYTSEPLVGQSGYQGTKDMVKLGVIKAKLRDTAGQSVTVLVQKRSATVIAETANGKVIVGNNMVRSGDPPSVNTEDGTFDIEFTGPSVTEN